MGRKQTLRRQKNSKVALDVALRHTSDLRDTFSEDALRQREPLFARAWESALSLARERLADDLLARSLKGSAEQIIRDGCIWGERHAYDNKLAFAILRRLDRRAELGATFRTPPADRIPDPVPAVSGDWQLLLDALGEDRKEDAALLLTPIPREVDEVDDPPVEGVEGDELDDVEPYVPKRVWQEYLSGAWRTNFPPPPDFDGEEKGKWESGNYARSLTATELAAVTTGSADEEGVTLEQDEADRDAFFAVRVMATPPPSAAADTSPGSGGGADPLCPSPSPGKVSARSDDGGGNSPATKKPQKPPKSEPPPSPDRSRRGASNSGETP